MASPKLHLDGASPETLRDFVEYLADEYHRIITVRFNAQTGAVAIVDGPNGRQIVTLNSGFRHKKPTVANPAHQGPSQEIANRPRGLVQEGPFKEIRNGREVTYLETPEGVRIEYEKT